jgi:hypothetical protein
MYVKKMLRNIFGPNRHTIAEQWRKLESEELRNMHSSPNIIKVIMLRKQTEHLARIAATSPTKIGIKIKISTE